MPNFEAIQTEDDITRTLMDDPWRVDVLKAAEELQLPNWWIGAGFLRNVIWDAIEGNNSPPNRDVDLVYFDPGNVEPETDWAYDEQQKAKFPFAEWEIRNQARMHNINNFAPYASTEDGIAHWVETATCVAVRLDGDKFKYLFSHGTADLFGLIARPIPLFRTADLLPVFHTRIQKKHWRERWPHLQILDQ
ncbi:MAG TPA: nucleotidyltransferase family protein [Candidatus Saccharimonadales bacterium]|nr:nucleotidyltransferase family protein [Candidatus Saccharimonadales bacterium]